MDSLAGSYLPVAARQGLPLIGNRAADISLFLAEKRCESFIATLWLAK